MLTVMSRDPEHGDVRGKLDMHDGAPPSRYAQQMTEGERSFVHVDVLPTFV